MKNILFVQPIFYPNDNVGERNIVSLTSIKKYYDTFKTSEIGITFIFGGWASNDDQWNKISSHINTTFGLQAFRFGRNYGKAITINNLVQIANNNNIKYDYILTCDSDIIFDIEKCSDMFNRLIEAATKIESHRNMPFGMIGLNQLGNNCHLKHCYQNTFEYISEYGSKEKIVWPSGSGGIAGGCVFIARRNWEQIGGYRVLGCYAGDDAYLLVDTVSKGNSIQLFDTVGIVHPPENDNEYQQWKIKVCQRDSHNYANKNMDAIIKEAEDFWKDRK